MDLPLGAFVLGQVPGQRVPRCRRPRARLLAEVFLLGEIGGGRHGAAVGRGAGALHGETQTHGAVGAREDVRGSPSRTRGVGKRPGGVGWGDAKTRAGGEERRSPSPRRHRRAILRTRRRPSEVSLGGMDARGSEPSARCSHNEAGGDNKPSRCQPPAFGSPARARGRAAGAGPRTRQENARPPPQGRPHRTAPTPAGGSYGSAAVSTARTALKAAIFPGSTFGDVNKRGCSAGRGCAVLAVLSEGCGRKRRCRNDEVCILSRAEDEDAAHPHRSPGQEGGLLGPLLCAFSLPRCDVCRGRATTTSLIWD